jgi:acyl dehydratase
MFERYFEDFRVGEVIELGGAVMEEARIIAFAREFDPQPFHVDPVAAKASMYGGIIASGWHTSAVYMRMLVDAVTSKSASLGSAGVEELRWLKPVRPGDVLSARFTITEVVPSTRHPDRGTVKSFSEVLNQRGEVVMTVRGSGMFGRRPAI